MELVRAAALTGYFEVAKELNLDTLPLLRRAGLTRPMIRKPGTPPGQQITGTYGVEPGGAVSLGAAYGRVRVEGIWSSSTPPLIVRRPLPSAVALFNRNTPPPAVVTPV